MRAQYIVDSQQNGFFEISFGGRLSRGRSGPLSLLLVTKGIQEWLVHAGGGGGDVAMALDLVLSGEALGWALADPLYPALLKSCKAIPRPI